MPRSSRAGLDDERRRDQSRGPAGCVMRAIRCHTGLRVSALEFKGTVLSQNDALSTTRVASMPEKYPLSTHPNSSDVLPRAIDVDRRLLGTPRSSQRLQNSLNDP
jgi:hypothetical protein